ncbi:flagellin N-terminal helical domain-containing protein [Chromobacterium vaccinii]|uniref:flagellin N-terminal helical domain-containing protein n=1 Tax=Chromobacterium vaccinii TaxID=1108595 RepID=UPI000E129A27|nr:flagellin [Chromobacterium vaccinii]SUX54062.1 Flagellin D [Chromobacterium vaccinii]
MLSLHTNIAALNTKSNMNSTQGALSTSMTRLGTGLRINSAMDDAAGLQIATRLDAQSRGMNVAMKNAQNGISMLQTAEGALNEVTNILQRMKDLGTEGATATATADDKKAMQAEYDALGKELTNIMQNTSFGGEKLLQGGKLTQQMNFQIGAASTESMTLNLKDNMTGLDTALKSVSSKYEVVKTDLEKADAAKAESLKKFTAAETAAKAAGGTVDTAAVTAAKAAAGGQDLAAIAGMPAATDANKQAQAEAYAKYYDGYVANASAANADVKKAVDALATPEAGGTEIGDKATIDTISKALDAVGTVRSALGANANRLDHVINNLSNVNNNTLAAKGRIMDTDYANESSTMTAKQMLMQASTSMLKQSGSMSSLAMSLLQ